MFKQLSLSIALNVEATFDSFYVSSDNQQALQALTEFTKPESSDFFFYLWGNQGSGVSHLLQSVQQQLTYLQAQYLPLDQLIEYPAEDVLSGLESLDWIILDNIDCLVSDKAQQGRWQEAIFHLYNRLKDANKKLLVGAHQSSRELPLSLADLQSRLQWGQSYRLNSLSDSDKQAMLILRADKLGLTLSEEVVQFILNNTHRNVHRLIGLLTQLDKASLEEKRRITIPFVKQVLQSLQSPA